MTEPNVESREDSEDVEPDEERGAEAEQRFSAEDVERIVKERLARDRRKRRDRQSKPPKQTDTRDNAEDSRWSDGSWRDDFYDAIDGYRLTRSQRRRLRESFKREQPDDPDAWVEEWCRDFGIDRDDEVATDEPEDRKTKLPTDDLEERDSEPAEPKPKPASDKGPPNPARDWGDILDPNALSEDDIKRMYQKHGKREAQRKIRTMAEAWARGRRVE